MEQGAEEAQIKMWNCSACHTFKRGTGGGGEGEERVKSEGG